MFGYIDKSKGLLFSTYDLQETLNNTNQALRKEVESIDSNRILNTSLSDLAEYLANKYKVTPLTLRKEEWHADQVETQVDVRYDSNRWIDDKSRPALVAGVRITIRVPFDGEADLFYTRSNQFTSSPPRAKIEGSELVLIYEMPNDARRELRPEIDAALSTIEEHIQWQHGLISNHNTSITQTATQIIASRRERLLANSNQLTSLGIPVKTRSDAPITYAIPEVRKKIVPTLPAATSAPYNPEPILTMELYEHILTIIQNMTLVMERSPSAFKKMGEEDLRQHFLVQLNGQFEGRATGETFNAEGKTDILLRENGSNVFIAECKFWKGQKHFAEAIDQLLGYTAWRDSKTAILVFNRGTEMSTVLSAVKESAEKHLNFKRTLTWPHESGYRFVFHNKNDKNREFILTVLVFDVPE
jgi:hypothetical protein